jgi:nucleoid-associated protein YgaU
MPNDAKLGLVVGVGLVIAVAVVFFRKDSTAPIPPTEDKAAVAVNGQPVPRGANHPVPAQHASQVKSAGPTRRHIVQQGETLQELAQRYYGDGQKSAALYRVNRAVLQAPDPLPPGTVIVIPDLAEPNP